MFKEWFSAFSKQGFDVTTYPYIVTFQSESEPDQAANKFTRNISRHCLLTTAPFSHPTNFRPLFKWEEHSSDSFQKRQHGVLSNVSRARKRLFWPVTRRPYRVKVKSISLIAFIVDVFTPPGGAVLGSYGGTLAAQIACEQQKRSYTSITMDADCFKAALNQLQQIVKPNPDYRICVTSVDKVDGSENNEGGDEVLLEYHERDEDELYFLPTKSIGDVQESIPITPTVSA